MTGLAPFHIAFPVDDLDAARHFYGTILGVFLVAFYMKNVNGTSVFISAVIAEIIVVVCWQADVVAFLWLNVLGCIILMFIAWLLSKMQREEVVAA